MTIQTEAALIAENEVLTEKLSDLTTRIKLALDHLKSDDGSTLNKSVAISHAIQILNGPVLDKDLYV
jgi:hypothetical protein